jgi:hypothetical protein
MVHVDPVGVSGEWTPAMIILIAGNSQVCFTLASPQNRNGPALHNLLTKIYTESASRSALSATPLHAAWTPPVGSGPIET